MSADDFFYLGFIKKTFGYKGELIIHLDVDDPDKYEKMESVFVETGGQPVPFFISHFEFRTDQTALVSFEEVDSEEKAAALSGKNLLLPITMLPKLPDDKFYLHEVTGFKLTDETSGFEGIIKEVLDIPGNPLFVLEKGGKEIILPMSREFISNVDKEGKTIVMKAPEGLVDIYFEEE